MRVVPRTRRLHGTVAIVALTIGLIATAAAAAGDALSVSMTGVSLSGGPLHLVVHVPTSPGATPPAVTCSVDGTVRRELTPTPGDDTVELEGLDLAAGWHRVEVRAGDESATARALVIPGWLSLLPPLVAILLALIFRDVVISLFVGVFTGALILTGGHPLSAFARSVDHFIAPSLADGDHAAIILFSTLLGGMVGVIGRSGGTQGIVDRLSGFARTARRGQVATWLMGVFIFFDDYANTLIVGSTMRPITDRLRISREKLAYIVDATAAPVASVVPITTWIGFEVGLIAAAFSQAGIGYNAYGIFIATIPYRFYPLLALVLGFTIAFTCRDFGPMLRAELRASSTGKLLADDAMPLADYGSRALEPPDGKPRRAVNALVPILTVIFGTIFGLYASGRAHLAVGTAEGLGGLQDVLASANPFDALLWASMAGVMVAVALAVVQRLLTVRESIEAMLEGFKSMVVAMVVLLLAWSIGTACGELHTAEFVVGATKGVLSPHWLPVLVFILAAAVSFATGTSWGTMAILMPLVIPVVHGLAGASGFLPGDKTHMVLLLGTISSVLAGSVWGDHCSPISDTTVMSSMASGCDHIAHVRTQIPYAVAIGLLGMLVGDIPTAFGLSPWISLAIGSAVIIIVVRFFGTRSDWRPGAAPPPAQNTM